MEQNKLRDREVRKKIIICPNLRQQNRSSRRAPRLHIRHPKCVKGLHILGKLNGPMQRFSYPLSVMLSPKRSPKFISANVSFAQKSTSLSLLALIQTRRNEMDRPSLFQIISQS